LRKGLELLQNTGQLKDIKDYISYAVDSLQVISSIILSLVSIIILPFFTEELEIGIIIVAALLIILGWGIYYFEKGSAHQHQIKGIKIYY